MPHNTAYCIAGFGGAPSVDSRIVVPCPLDRNALRNRPDNMYQPLYTSINKEQTEKEIEEIRSEYIKNPDNFSKKHEEIILESVDTKRALKNGFQKMSKH